MREKALTWLLGVIAAVAVIWFLRAAALVVVPLAAAFFIALVVQPVLSYVRERLPRYRWAAVPLAMALIVVILGGFIWAAAESVDEAAERAPRYADRLQRSWQSLQQTATGYGVPIPEDVLGSGVQQRLGAFFASTIRTAWQIVSGLVLVLFLVLLMLLEAPAWSGNMRRVLRDHHGATALDTIASIADKVRRYLYVRTLLGLMSAVAAGIWLWLLSVDLVLVWVVLTFALNYIPNLGSIVAVIPPSLMALVQHGPVRGLIVIAGLTVFEQIIGNFIDPRMQGRRLQISPSVVLVALVFWTWVWGPVGALLAVPMTVTALAAAAHVPALAPFAEILAAEEPDRES
ncbi:MAG TPA: AI-2E family transporter [Vicinamibacterales bacterium]|nr:AI-2E family transporter [Vicinamibacterales bacterium]